MSTPDEQRVRDLLQAAAPADQDAVGRAAAVRRRSRRGRVRAGVGAGLAVVVLLGVGAIVPSLLDRGGADADRAEDPAAGGTGAAASVGWEAAPCPTDPIDVSGTDNAALPPTAVSVRLCRAQLTIPGGEPILTSWEGPIDALVTDVDGFLAESDGLPAYRLPDECAAILATPDPWALVLTRPSGERQVVGAAGIVCAGVSLGAREVSAADLQTAFVEALGHQRAQLEPPGSVQAECPAVVEGAFRQTAAPDTVQPASRESVVAGAICYTVDPLGSREYARDRGELPPAAVRTVVADIDARRTGQPREAGGCADSGPTRIVVLVDEWGDRTSWTDNNCTGEFTGAAGYWVPGADAQEALLHALGDRVPPS